MSNDLQKVDDDLRNNFWPEDENAHEKIKCGITNGMRIKWYYADDREYAILCELTPREDAPWEGVVVVAPGREISSPDAEIDIDDAIVVVSSHPCEKCYPESSWVTLSRLIDDAGLVEVFDADSEAESGANESSNGGGA